MNGRWVDAERPRVRPHFVQRDQAVVDVERRVLDPFCRDGARDLLELADEPPAILALFRRRDHRLLEQQPLDEIKDHRGESARALFGALNRFGDVPAIVRSDRLVLCHVGPVHWKARDDFLQRGDQAVQREVAEMSVPLGEAVEAMPKRIDVPRHRLVHDLLLAPVGHVGERVPLAPLADEPHVDLVEGALVSAIHEQVVHDRRELVAGRPVDGPFGRGLLVRPEDLFYDDVEGVGVAPARLRAARLEAAQVVARRVQAVHVIDA